MRKIETKKWIRGAGRVFLIIGIVIIIYYIFFNPQNFNKTYDAVVIDITDHSLVETTSMKIKGERLPKCPFIREDAKIKKAHIYVDYLDYTLEDQTYSMLDIDFSKHRKDLYFAWIQYFCSNTMKQPFKDSENGSYSYTKFGPLYLYTTCIFTNNTKLEKVLMPVDRTNSKSKNYNQFIAAPAKTLEEAINIYNEFY